MNSGTHTMDASHTPFTLAMVGSMGAEGDSQYRMHQPASALAELGGIEVYEVEPTTRLHDAIVLAADLVVFTMTLDIEVFRLIHQRQQLGRISICEANDYLPDVQPWNPAHTSWSDARAQHCFHELIQRCNATQVTTEALKKRVQAQAQQVLVFPNHVATLPAPRQFEELAAPTAERPLRIGWGGSCGHRADLHAIAPSLIQWLQQHENVQLHIMSDPQLAEPFAVLPPDRFVFQHAGSLTSYLDWLKQIDIGLAPLLPSEYNRCRSDVKFLEYASHGVAPVLQNLEPYQHLTKKEVALFFNNNEELIQHLNQLISHPTLISKIAQAAYAYVGQERLINNAITARHTAYRNLLNAATPAAARIEPNLQQASQQPLQAMPGWERHGRNHWRMPCGASPGDTDRRRGIKALQKEAFAEAIQAFKAALKHDPSDATSCSFLGLCLERLGKRNSARIAFEHAARLDPLQSRPVRALARLHRQAAAHYNERATALNPRK